MDLQGSTSERSVRSIPLGGKFLLLLVILIAAGWLFFPARSVVGQHMVHRDHFQDSPPSDKSLALAPTNIDLEIQKSHSGDFVIGSSAVYVIAVTNVGTDTVSGPVTVTDNLPIGLTPMQVDGAGWSTCAFNGQLLTCVYSNSLGILPSGGLPPIILTTQVGQAAAPSVSNIATLVNISDTNSANNSFLDEATVVSADLAVSKSLTPTIITEGSTVTFTIGLVNHGPSNTTGVVLTDTLASGLTFSSSNASKGTYTASSGAWNVGDLALNEGITLTISAVVNPNTRGTEIVDAIDGVVSSLFDYNLSNNTASVTVRVQTTRVIGQVLDLGTNQPILSATLVLTDSLNHVYSTTSAASGWFTFTDSITIPIATGAAELTASKVNYASADASPNILAGVDNRQDMQLGTSNLLVSMVDGKTTVLPGEIFTYTLAISNTGSIPAAQVIITDVLPTYLTYITDTLDISPTIPVAKNYVWRLPNELQPNQRISFRIRVQVAQALPSQTTSIKNSVRVRTSSPELNQSNNLVEDTNTSAGTANVGITISVSPSQVRTAQNATYTIRVTNTGTSPVTDATVTDTFSNFLDLVSSNTSKGKATTNNTTRRVTVEIGILNNNETVTITVVGKVNNSATTNTTVTNAATVTYKFAGQTQTRTSTNTSFQLIVSSTLPGTGGMELPASSVAQQNVERPRSGARIYPLALTGASILGILGVSALLFAIKLRRRPDEWGAWYFKMGILFTTTAVLFGLAAWGFWKLEGSSGESSILASSRIDSINKVPRFTYTEEPIIMPAWATNEPAVLPDFPIPTPTYEIPPDPDRAEPDISPINRILVPAIGLDTVVKYVPYDGLTWLIAGLHQEVAWMGDTSWPGLGGNTALAGHVTLRTGGDGPFRHLELLTAGDEITIATEENIYLYRVQETRVVAETDLSILEIPGDNLLTLITCTDWNGATGFYQKRLVVFAELAETTPINATAFHN